MTSKTVLRWLIVCVVVFFVFLVATAFYLNQLTGNHIMGWPVDAVHTREIFHTLFRWDANLSDYDFQEGSFSQAWSTCKTAIFFLQNVRGGDKKEVLIIAHLADLTLYEPETIDVQKADIPMHRIYVKLTNVESRTLLTSLFPNLVFNFRKIPKGQRLRVYGIDTCFCRDTVLGEWEVKILEGDFNELGFEVVPNDRFVKNIPQIMGFEGFRKHGALIFLRDKENRTIMMIQFVESVKGDEYKPYLDSLLEKLPALSIKNL